MHTISTRLLHQSRHLLALPAFLSLVLLGGCLTVQEMPFRVYPGPAREAKETAMVKKGTIELGSDAARVQTLFTKSKHLFYMKTVDGQPGPNR